MKNQLMIESSLVRRLPLLFMAMLLAGLALIVVLVPLARAADTSIYVRPGGDDTHCNGTANLDYNPAVAPDCALQTLQKAFDMAGSGSNIIYTDESFSTTFPLNDGIGAAAASLSISKSDSPDPVDVGDPLIYTIIVTNTDTLSPAMDVTLFDFLPPSGVVVHTDGSATVSQGTGCGFLGVPGLNVISCTLGTLNPGASATVTIPVTPTAAGLVVNEAEAVADNVLAVDIKETTRFSGTTNVSISKSDSPDPVPVGSQLVYTIIVTNSGPHAAVAVTVTDILPANTTFVPPPTSSPGCSQASGIVTCNVGFLGVNQSETLTIVVIPGAEGVITNTAVVTPSGIDLDTSNNVATETTTVIQVSDVYLPIIYKNFAGPFVQLSWLHKNEDRVSDADGATGLITDTIDDGAFLAAVNVGTANSKTISHARFESTEGIVWDTLNGNGVWVLGVYDGNTLLNDPADGTIDGMVVNGQVTVSIYASDEDVDTRFPPNTYLYTLTVFFTDGTSASGQAIIPSSTPPPPPPSNLAYVSDVAADIETNQIFIASPRQNWVYAIEGISDTVTHSVPVGNGPTGLTVLSATVLADNKVFVAHQYGANFFQPGVKAFGVNDLSSHDTSDGGFVGVVPVKIAANGTNNSRVYVSNYIDKLAVLDGASGPPENRLGWVVQKGFQGAYGIDASSATNRAYLATRDSGELVVFDGNNDRLLESGYIPTHIKPPQTCSLWSVAVNPTTGHVFVPCPQLSKVFVLAEGQISVLNLETLGVLEKRDGHLALVVSPAAAPWIAEVDVPGGTNLGEEGIAIDTNTGYVFITNASNDTLVILQDGGTPSYVTTVAVGDQPQGVDVNRITQKVYVGNTGDNTVTVLDAASPFSLIQTIPLTP